MNDVRPPEAPDEEQLQALGTLFQFHELWLAERMPETGRDDVFWQGDRIPYDERRRELESQRKFFVSPAPYPGLRSFTPQEARVFFGRRSDVEAVRDRLKEHRMVMVLGGSGSGKSSLVRAGVLPHLNGVGRIGGRGGTWYWCEFRPEQSAMVNMAKALAAHVVTPLLRAIAARAADTARVAQSLAELGLSPGASEDDVRAWVAGLFGAAKSDDELFDALWTFVDRTLDRLDDLATGGIKAGKANLLILLDQFEEIFREARTPGQERQTEQLLGLLARMDERLRVEPGSVGGLFMALTMRSEELHRCGEYDGLADIVNRSVFLLELLDPERPVDQRVLHRAIVEPARRVFISYGLPFDSDDKDSPFAPGVPAWLIDGARKERAVEHRPDQLPLLQHALRSIWDQAVSRWKAEGAACWPPRVEQRDLPGDNPETDYPDLDVCLSVRADAAADEARDRFRNFARGKAPGRLSAEDCPEGETVLRAALSALSRQDDRGNRARRFASLDEIAAFAANDATVRKRPQLRTQVERALSPLIFHGYLTGGGGRPYDISHEALIRNWTHCTRWLRQNEEVARALRRFLDDVDPDEFEALQEDDKIAENFAVAFRNQIGLIGENREVPESWAIDQLDLMLRASADRRRIWVGEHCANGVASRKDLAAVLARIQRIARRAKEARDAVRARDAERNAKLALMRQLEENERRARESAAEAREAEAKAQSSAEDARAAEALAQRAAEEARAEKVKAEHSAEEARAEKARAESSAEKAREAEAKAQSSAEDARAAEALAQRAAEEARAEKVKAEHSAEEARAEKAKAESSAEKARRSEAKATRRLFLVGAALLVAMVLIFNTSVALGVTRRVLATSQIESSLAMNWSQATKLGILKKLRPLPFAPFLVGDTRAKALQEGERWDRVARLLIGGNYWLPREAAPLPSGASARCWMRGADWEWAPRSADANGPLSGFASSSRTLSIAAKGRQLLLSVRQGSGGQMQTVVLDLAQQPALPGLLARGTEVCVSHDATILTASQPGNAVPNVFELNLINCPDCAVALNPINASIRPNQGIRRPDRGSLEVLPLPQHQAQVVSAASVTAISSYPKRDDLVGVQFVSNFFTGRPTSYVANFYRGWATAERLPGSGSTARNDCGAPKSNNRNQRFWRCGDRRHGDLVVRFRDPTNAAKATGAPPSLVPLVVEIQASGSARLRAVTVAAPPDVTPLGRGRWGTFLLRDRTGDLWWFKIDEKALEQKVAALGDGSNLPDSVLEAAPSLISAMPWLKQGTR